MTSVETTNLLDELRDKVLREHALIHHPFMKAAVAGELTAEQVKGFVRDFWVIPHSHLINNAGLSLTILWTSSSLTRASRRS